MAQGHQHHLAGQLPQSAEASATSLHITAASLLPPTLKIFPGYSLHLRVKFKILTVGNKDSLPWPKQPHPVPFPCFPSHDQTSLDSSPHLRPFEHAVPVCVDLPCLCLPKSLIGEHELIHLSLVTSPESSWPSCSPLKVPYSLSFVADITLRGVLNRSPLFNAYLSH